MTPRPIHRWKTFWLGILVFLFLGWAWERSIKYRDSLSYGSPGGSFMIYCRNSSGSVALDIGFTRSFPGRIIPPGFDHNSERLFGHRWLGGTFEITRFDANRYWIQIAHWLLIVLFLIPWLTFLAWRHRKHRKQQQLPRLTESDSESPPPPATHA